MTLSDNISCLVYHNMAIWCLINTCKHSLASKKHSGLWIDADIWQQTYGSLNKYIKINLKHLLFEEISHFLLHYQYVNCFVISDLNTQNRATNQGASLHLFYKPCESQLVKLRSLAALTFFLFIWDLWYYLQKYKSIYS